MKIQLSSLFFLSICPLFAGIPDVAGPISGDVSENQVTFGCMLHLNPNAPTDIMLKGYPRPIKLVETGRDWGPKNQNKENKKAEGCLSDHPWVWCEFEMPKIN